MVGDLQRRIFEWQTRQLGLRLHVRAGPRVSDEVASTRFRAGSARRSAGPLAAQDL